MFLAPSDTLIIKALPANAPGSMLSAPTAALLGALIAAVSGLVVALLNSERQRKLEAEKWPRLREDALASDIRAVTREIAAGMASALHSICWLTWLAHGKPDAITSERIEAYNAEMHRLLPDTTGSLATIAALDRDAYEQFAPLVHEIEVLDVRVGEASLGTFGANGSAAQALARLHAEGDLLSGRLPGEIANITSQAIERRAKRVATLG